ncbi:hypothetical protein O181_073405 [Austropuccinia psidii MF-1]|uniref:Uncharacterized protein n=1 Tax=Austropuccinia psidii MF-1 TaxID=1389203 RepID=A0A9Q3FAG7_9BASI|nr:hypothetical protein [Austropuccinia psidii MF-1]
MMPMDWMGSHSQDARRPGPKQPPWKATTMESWSGRQRPSSGDGVLSSSLASTVDRGAFDRRSHRSLWKCGSAVSLQRSDDAQRNPQRSSAGVDASGLSVDELIVDGIVAERR